MQRQTWPPVVHTCSKQFSSGTDLDDPMCYLKSENNGALLAYLLPVTWLVTGTPTNPICGGPHRTGAASRSVVEMQHRLSYRQHVLADKNQLAWQWIRWTHLSNVQFVSVRAWNKKAFNMWVLKPAPEVKHALYLFQIYKETLWNIAYNLNWMISQKIM